LHISHLKIDIGPRKTTFVDLGQKNPAPAEKQTSPFIAFATRAGELRIGLRLYPG
jgi:hypothetical protein